MSMRRAEWLLRMRIALRRARRSFWYWMEDEGRYFSISAAVHAVALLSLALFAPFLRPSWHDRGVASTPTIESFQVDERNGELDKRPYEVGETPITPSELTTATLLQFEAQPLASQTAKYFDDSADFEDAGGGQKKKKEGPQLGGLGGFSLKQEGVAGRGGVGFGSGESDTPGVGGAGEGFGSRGKGHRDAILGATGGTKASERAVAAALNWLHRHQQANGQWSLQFSNRCSGAKCGGPGAVKADAAATAFGLLPFFGSGQTHKSEGPYKKTIGLGLSWLIKHQQANGDLSANGEQRMYSHGVAAIALCEAFGMTRDPQVGTAAQRAIGFIEQAQNHETGAWRYEPGQTGDTSVTGWMIMALRSGQMAGLAVNSYTFESSRRWLRAVAKGESMGLYSYLPYREVTPTMTAVGMLCQQYLGMRPNDPSMLEGKRYLMNNLPSNDDMRNVYYWYYATLTMHNFLGPEWDAWNRTMRRALISTQSRTGCATGSWDPNEPTLDVWGEKGGRLMMTSLAALSLEIYYRYMPLFRNEEAAPAAPAADPAKMATQPAPGAAPATSASPQRPTVIAP